MAHHLTTKDTKGSENETPDAIVQTFYVEVDQQFDLHHRQIHESAQLGFVNPLDFLNTLQFDDQLVLHQNAERHPHSSRMSLYCTGPGFCW